jgi:hypothetical protein
MVVVGMTPIPLKVIRIKVCLWAKLFLGYQKILDPKNTHTLERGKSKKNQGIYGGGRNRCAL